ncbi:LysM peptidoglycan-binding domain-containing protein [Haliangium sp.]|uniref:LysM peptidoglycan-binding domain-containing protein n=1 Tax=Haliangium sp. TaxID=2663208 RepID=UPI003D110B75
MSAVGCALSVILLTLAVALPAAAQPREDRLIHRTKRGDTLALLAAEYYGDRDRANLIATANQLDSSPQGDIQPLRPGLRLVIPTNRQVTTERGQTLESLAEAYLGDARRAPFLASFNSERPVELPPGTILAAGQVLDIPLHVHHTVQARDQLRALSLTYYGNARRVRLIREYNFLDSPVLEPGVELLLPIPDVSVRPARLPPPDAEAQARDARHRAMQSQADSALAAARAWFRAGSYGLVRDAMAGFDLDYLFTGEVIEVGVLLGSAHVALGDDEAALAVFRQVRARAPEHELDPYEVSPTVRAVWGQATGDGERGE